MLNRAYRLCRTAGPARTIATHRAARVAQKGNAPVAGPPPEESSIQSIGAEDRTGLVIRFGQDEHVVAGEQDGVGVDAQGLSVADDDADP